MQNQWDQLIPALDRGNFDIILSGLEISEEHQQHVAMSLPYYVYAQQIVTRESTEGLTNLASLKGKIVGVLSGTVAQRLVEEMHAGDVRIYPGNVEGLRDLKAHRIDATVMDLPIAVYYAKPDAELKFSGPSFAPGYYGIGVRKEDVTLLAALNQAIGELDADHTLERIYRKYNVWDERQATLKDYQPEVVQQRKAISTLREWPKYLPLLLRGAAVTVEISILAMAVAVVAGLVIVLARLYGVAPLRWLAKAYVEVIRGTPLLIQLFLIYYGLAANRHPPERLLRGDFRAGVELRRERGGELSRGHRGDSQGADGSGARAGHEPVAGVAAHHSAAGVAAGDSAGDERFHRHVQGFVHRVGHHDGGIDESLRDAGDVHV